MELVIDCNMELKEPAVYLFLGIAIMWTLFPIA